MGAFNIQFTDVVQISIPIITGAIGYFIHVAQSNYDTKDTIKSTARLLKVDIENTTDLLSRIKELNNIVTDRLTIISDG